MRWLMTIVSAALLCIVADGETLGMDDKEIIQCLNYAVCEAGRVQEFREIVCLLKPMAMDQTLQLMRENYAWPEAENDDATWAELPNKYCPLDDAKKEVVTGSMGLTMGDYWEELCDAGEEEECQAFDDSIKAFSQFISGLIAQAKCGKTADAMKSMKPPGFGR